MEEDTLRTERIMRLLRQWRAGDRNALAELTPLVYRELHRLATSYMRRERKGHTLQATALVNEAFARLVRGSIPFDDAKHFYGVTAKLMRHILVDHAKGRNRRKRNGGDSSYEASLPEVEITGVVDIDLLELEDALRLLERQNKDTAEMVELYYFGGLTVPQVAAALDVSESTVERNLRFAKAWLLKELRTSQ